MTEQKSDTTLSDIQNKITSIDDAERNLSENKELISRAINGESGAFDQLYMQSYRYVFFVIRNYIPDDETTYDAMQETFIKVYKGISKLREPAAYYSWITTIAKNTAKNFLRSKHNETSITDDEDYSLFLKQDHTKKDVELDIERVLKELESQDAELLSLVYYDGMRVTQIAKMRGVPAATVYTQLGRAKKNLKAQLKVHGIDKAVYSGDLVSMIATAIRNIIGTSLLSVVIAQQILNGVVKGKGKKEIAVAKVIKQQQKKSILKIASCIVAISMITTVITVIALSGFIKNKTPKDNISTSTSSESVISSSHGTAHDASQNSNAQTIFDNNTSDSSSSDNQTQSDIKEEPSSDAAKNSKPSTMTNSSSVASNALPPSISEDMSKPITATYIYRDATAEDCYTKENIPAYPVEDVIVITGVATAASDGVYTIPEMIDGKRVGAIMPSAFCDDKVSSTVKKVVVPATVKTIWQNAFSDCYNLTDIYLCGSTINIFENSFADKSVRSSKLTIHCSYECKNFDFYYYRNIAKDYNAEYEEWNGDGIQ